MTDNQIFQEDKTLSRLVSQLSLEERHDFLEKLRGQSTLSCEPLYAAAEEKESHDDFETQLVNLPWFIRLFYFFLSLIKGKPSVKLFEERQIGKLGRAIEAEAPKVYDYQQNRLLFEFFSPLTELKESARFFFTALDASINRDKGAFYAFLGSLEMGKVHRYLQTETNPEYIIEQSPGIDETELRQLALRAMEEAFTSISDEERNAMYYNARSLNYLKELSAFLFDRVIMAFGIKPGGQSCPVSVVRDLLINLNNILFSLKEPPGLSLLESLFVFLLQDKSAEEGFDMSREMHTLLFRAEKAISTIRNFNQRIPLTKILRCSTRDLSLSPKQISGGEDWFQVYRDYWKQQVEGELANFLRRRNYIKIVGSFKIFLKGASLRVLDNAASESKPDGIPVPEAFILSFLRTFHSVVFMKDINPVLSPILTDGEFARKENRAEFTEAYNTIMIIEEEIKKIDANLAPSGEYGKRYIQAKQEFVALPVKRRKMQIVLDDISHEATGIIIRARSGISKSIHILSGILKKEFNGKSENMAGFDKITIKGVDEFTKGIKTAIILFQQTLDLLKDIDALGNPL